jgi:hypothetical protein
MQVIDFCGSLPYTEPRLHKGIRMGQQYKKVKKRRRRLRYIERQKARKKKAPAAKAS